MSTRSQREFLKVQLLEAQRMKEMAKNHPLMSVAFAEREQELLKQIEQLPLGGKEARTVLFFSGEPVQGSIGIDASFAGRVLGPFQSMVKTDYADRFHGMIGKRGRRLGETESQMLLTGLPRGSFGLELSKAENDELFEENQLADTLAHITKLVESSARSDENFAAELDETAPRVINNLREFLEVIAKGKAGLRIETGDFRCVMTPIEANEAYNRVAGTLTKEDTTTVHGVLRGVTLDSWNFNFLDEQNHTFAGKIDKNLTEEMVVSLNQKFFNQRCVASMLVTTVTFKNGRVRTTYTLTGLDPISQNNQ